MPDLSVSLSSGRACPACRHAEHPTLCNAVVSNTGAGCQCNYADWVKDQPKPDPVPGGIYDLSNGQCTAAALLRGEHIPCELATQHDGWSHQNLEHKLLWQNAQPKTVYSGIRGAGGIVAVGGAGGGGGGGGRGVGYSGGGGAIGDIRHTEEYGQRGPE